MLFEVFFDFFFEFLKKLKQTPIILKSYLPDNLMLRDFV